MIREIIRGQSVTISTQFFLDIEQTQPASLTGATVFLIAKKRGEDIDANKLFEKSIGSGVTVTDVALGKVDIVITATDTNPLTIQSFYYETVAKLSDGVTVIRNGVNQVNLLGNVRRSIP